MKKLLIFTLILLLSVLCSACVNSVAVHKLNTIAAEYMNKGEIDKAISRLEASVDLDETIYDSRYNLAVAYMKNNDCEKAYNQILAAKKLIKTEDSSVFYTEGVCSDCIADKIFKTKNEDGEIVDVVFEDEIQEKEAVLKYIEFLNNANNAYKNYLSISPSAQDSSEVNERILQNEEKINETKNKYNL